MSMQQLVNLFRESKTYIVLNPIQVEVAVDGFTKSSPRKLSMGMSLSLIGGKLKGNGYSFFKSGGIFAPIKIRNEYRLNKSIQKALPLKTKKSGHFDCGTPFPSNTEMYMLGGKTVKATLVAFNRGTRYHLTVEPADVLKYCRIVNSTSNELFTQEKNWTNNLHTDAVSTHFGKETRSSRYSG